MGISDVSWYQNHRSTRKFLLDEDLALQSGKCEELDARLPRIVEKVFPFYSSYPKNDLLRKKKS